MIGNIGNSGIVRLVPAMFYEHYRLTHTTHSYMTWSTYSITRNDRRCQGRTFTNMNGSIDGIGNIEKLSVNPIFITISVTLPLHYTP
ncbi:hypothetical protein CB0940_10106 [Cercospora beticola]|uniref:Uncharacterized protein n=1 Tax=Cercospora beticola TaxID=122368 RepID=A0A2G5HUS8_CERBT|nr:hypothetical protein CB0940_10106 [Cercospora beticola]PIA96289.1 hypothetical protein CB0940_10106 [Cercospora beticola]